MKKYLMTGITALAFCVGFTSCSHDIEGPEGKSAYEAQKAVMEYEAAFIKTFGQPASNQDWGFGNRTTTARTRVNAADGNEWGAPTDDPNEYDRGWIVPDTLTDAQKLRVTRYFQTHPYLTYVDPQWQNFFVQQVYTGGTNVLNADTYSKDIHEPNAQYGYSPEIYKSADKLSTENPDITSDKLNYLFAYGETEHINNFNGATGSYKPVLETGEDVNNGKKHDDRINLMYQSSTYDFSYQNAYSSVRHGQPYVALVSAQTIDAWADSVKIATGIVIGEPVYDGTSYSGKPNSYWNRSFLGCDLELLIGEEIYDGTNMKLTDAKDLGAQGRFVDGEYVAGIPEGDYIYKGAPVRNLIINQNKYGGDLIKLNDSDLCYDYRKKWTDENGNHDEYVGKVLDTKKIDKLLDDGYLPVAGTGLKTWVKPEPVADHFYSDWIVTLTKAMRQDDGDDPVKPVLRVFAEDLSAKASENAGEESDWDFNDVVFDAKYVDANHAEITLWAAGGTLPLQINSIDGTLYEGGCEVHAKFGQSEKTMINTHAKEYAKYGNGWIDNLQEKVFTITIPNELIQQFGGDFDSDKYKENFPLAVRDLIRIEVFKGESWIELTAAKGKPACKIATSASGVKWLKERTHITNGYPTFQQYVGYPSVEWWDPAVEDALYPVTGNTTQCKWCNQ
jgi:hypothetical protein